MAGSNDRVHGYNPVYRSPAAQQNAAARFQSFPLAANGARPDRFRNLQVQVQGADHRLDHQGHIVPQNFMNIVLDPLMLAMSSACHSAAQVDHYIADAQHNAAWLAPAVSYGNAFHIPMFDFETQLANPNTLANAEDRIGNLFAIVAWNPVNICRAPDDTRRNGVPGNSIDARVLAWLTQHHDGVNGNWLDAANTLAAAGAAPTAAQVHAYLQTSTATLEAQQHTATGFYSFAWQTGAGNAGLVPV